MTHKFTQTRRVLFCALLSAFSLPTHASEILAEVDPFFQEMPLVLTASRLSQPLSEAPSAVTVIDKPMIKASGFRSVPELMRLVPGMYVGFADANRPVVSLHNSTDEFAHRMQIMIDGRSIYLPPFGGVNWADLPLLIEDIERIEVVRGPSTASHGTNAFFGVVNIITREAAGQDSGNLSITGGFAKDASARMSRSVEKFDYRLSAGYRSDQGLDDGKLNDHNATKIFNWRSNYHPNNSDSFDVQIGASDGIYGQGIVDGKGIVRKDNIFRETTAQSDFQQLNWLHAWPENDETKVSYSHSVRKSLDPMVCVSTDTCDGNKEPTTPRSQGFRQQTVYSLREVFEVQNTNQIGSANRLVWGASSNRDYADYPLLLRISHTVNSWNVFAHDEWRISEAAILNVGTMFEDNGMNSRNSSPRASINYHLNPKHTLRFGVSTATRSPVMTESYIDANNVVLGGAYVSPSIPLKPEKIISREFGYLGEFTDLALTLDARVYMNQVSDLILVDKYVTKSASGDYPDSFKNMGSADFKGIDATVKYRWDEGRSFLSANYSYQRAEVSLGSYPTQYFNTAADPTGDYATIAQLVQAFYKNEFISQFPETVVSNGGSLLLSKHFADSWQFSAGYYFRGLVRVIDVSPDVTPERRMRRWDIRLAKTFKLEKGRSAEVAAIVQNVTQDEYTKYGTLNETANIMFTRRGWVTVSFNF